MVVFSLGTIHEFAREYPPSTGPLNDWYSKTKKANWSNFTEIKQVFNSCDSIGKDRFVFNIGGNNYRLIAVIHFNIRTVYIRGIMTHKEYDRLNKDGTLTTI
jgi:mRNA interferase HigB